MTLTALLDLLCPAVAGKDEEAKQTALTYAESKRPAGLSEDEQNEAQAYYAGYLLAKQLSQTAVAPVGVTSEREGDLSRSYGDNGLSDDPLGYLEAYKRLKVKALGINAPLVRG